MCPGLKFRRADARHVGHSAVHVFFAPDGGSRRTRSATAVHDPKPTLRIRDRSGQTMLLLPFRPEKLALSSEPLADGLAIDDSVDAEVPEVGPELAPSR